MKKTKLQLRRTTVQQLTPDQASGVRAGYENLTVKCLTYNCSNRCITFTCSCVNSDCCLIDPRTE